MRVKESANQRDNESKIANFLDIDTSKITFSTPKPNKYNGTQIGILYEGKTLFVIYERLTPFGLKKTLIKMVIIKVQACKLIAKTNT